MKKIGLLALLLAGCGGGSLEINCMVANSCAGNIAITAPAASAPGISPVVTPPPSPSIPFAPLQTSFPLRAAPGSWILQTPGETFVLVVVETAAASWVGIYKAESGVENAPLVAVETVLDSSLDITPPASGGDVDLRTWISARILLNLNLWLAANAYRLGGVALAPVASALPPESLPLFPRLAARLPQLLKLTAVNGSFIATF